MKTSLEKISSVPDSSFRWLIDPKLNHFYFWHFHPEYELVYIVAPQGNRHVGEHKGSYVGSDFVLIGSNIPHLNFDYGIESSYNKTVLHIQQNFLKNCENTPELVEILTLFEHSKYGVLFGQQSKNLIAGTFQNVHKLSGFEQFLAMIDIFKKLAKLGDYTLLHINEPVNLLKPKETDRIRKLNDFVKDNYHRKIELKEVASLSSLNEAAFCRYFKNITKLTFVEFLNHYRVNEAKKILANSQSVTEACFACGFDSLSYFNRTFKKITGQNPSKFAS